MSKKNIASAGTGSGFLPEERSNLAFGKMNYIICGVSVLIIILGFVLMTGSDTTFPTVTSNGFQPDIFSTRRIVVAPMTCFFGFLLMIAGVLYPTKREKISR